MTSVGEWAFSNTNIDKVYFCCLYGNTEEEVIIRSIERDDAYEDLIVTLEGDFWENNVLAKVPPPYFPAGGRVPCGSDQR